MVKRYSSQVNARAVTDVVADCSLNVGEVLGYFRTDLVTLGGNGRAHAHSPLLGIATHFSRCGGDDSRGESAPTRVDDGEPTSGGTRDHERNTIGDQDGGRVVRTVNDQRVRFGGGICVFDRRDVGSVNLADNRETLGSDSDGSRHAASIFCDGRDVVPHVVSKVERRVGTDAHASEAIGHEGVHTESRE